MVVNGEVNEGLNAGGPWPGELQEGNTHVVHEAKVTQGDLSIGIVGGYFGAAGFLNGVQLRRNTPADIDGDGIVGIVDFLGVLGQWGPCGAPGTCPGDVDDDGSWTSTTC